MLLALSEILMVELIQVTKKDEKIRLFMFDTICLLSAGYV